MQPGRLTYRCQHCGSESVDKQVPYEWNACDQAWEPNFLKTDYVCRSCGHDQPAAELYRVRGAQVLLTGTAMARLEEAALFYLEHAELPEHEIETLRAALEQFDSVPIRELEIDTKSGSEWTPEQAEADAPTPGASARRNVHPLWSPPRARSA